MFPIQRLRRLRMKKEVRDLVSETILSVKDFVYPLFIVTGKGVKKEINSMPGVFHFSVDKVLIEIAEIRKAGITAVLLFGIPDKKDEIGSGSFAENGIVQKAVREIKKRFPELVVITDICLCEYTSHGHCGIIEKGEILNDETLKILGDIAVSHALAGADIVAPSDMMDGRIQALREALDGSGFMNLPIMSYAAKYSSSFYGPFREAAFSAPKFGDRKSYQMNYANSNEALLEIQEDIEEGADIVMVKPALSYLDIIRRAKEQYLVPLAAYNVSGEYSMVKAAAQKGWIDEAGIVREILTSIKRAGADIIITYHAKEAAKSKWILK